MNTVYLSACFCTNSVTICKEFYQKYFSAKVSFDCGWYVDLAIGGCDGTTVQFMEPQGEQPVFGGEGATLNFKVENVDAEYERLTGLGLRPIMPLDDHDWGDRGFSMKDPIGITLYIYSDREPSEEFKQYYNE